MRVLCRDGNYATAVEYAKCNGKQLVLITSNGVSCCTDDYFSENLALCALDELVKNGYIMVDRLYPIDMMHI